MMFTLLRVLSQWRLCAITLMPVGCASTCARPVCKGNTYAGFTTVFRVQQWYQA